jgi:hypothetical protein
MCSARALRICYGSIKSGWRCARLDDQAAGVGVSWCRCGWRNPHLYQAGFNWLGQWQTGDEVTKQMAVSACIQEFLLQPDRGVIYATLKDTSSPFQRRKLIQDSELASAFDVADACDEQIRALDATLFPPA